MLPSGVHNMYSKIKSEYLSSFHSRPAAAAVAAAATEATSSR